MIDLVDEQPTYRTPHHPQLRSTRPRACNDPPSPHCRAPRILRAGSFFAAPPSLSRADANEGCGPAIRMGQWQSLGGGGGVGGSWLADGAGTTRFTLRQQQDEEDRTAHTSHARACRKGERERERDLLSSSSSPGPGTRRGKPNHKLARQKKTEAGVIECVCECVPAHFSIRKPDSVDLSRARRPSTKHE